MKINEIDLEPYKEAFLLSNNPRQMWKSFVKVGSIESIWKNEKPETLVDEYKELTRNGILEFDSLIKAYIITIAATNFPYRIALQTLDAIDLSLLGWGDQIKRYYKNSSRNMITLTSNAQARIESIQKNPVCSNTITAYPQARIILQENNSDTTNKQVFIKRGKE
jgi:hypothetical protein